MKAIHPFFRQTLTAFAAILAVIANAHAAAEKQPNIILIMADDVSPEMYGCYGGENANTPNLDRLAQEGVMFNTAWGAALCAPARAQIMTGNYATTTGYWYNGFSIPQADGSDDLFSFYKSFGKLMQDAGYATAVAGKWHVGGAQHPEEPIVGFDEYCLWEGTKELQQLPGKPEHTGGWEDERTPSRYWHPCIIQNHKKLNTKPHDYGPAVFTEFLSDFMERSVEDGKPFLAYYPMVAPHGARTGTPTSPIYGEPGDNTGDKKDNAKRFQALNDYIDILVGRLEQKAKDLGIIDNTIIIFTSDNGTAVTAKSRGVERGCRVPFIAYGAGIKKRGATKEICDLTDILPTLVDFAGEEIPSNIPVDGQSLKPFLTGQSDQHRDYIFGCIGTTRLVRSRTHLLEVVNPVLGVPDGRFYYCGDNHDGRSYVRAESNPEHAPVRAAFQKVLDSKPGLTADHPYFLEEKGAKWLKSYTDPKSAAKHLYNHKNYKFYDETIND